MTQKIKDHLNSADQDSQNEIIRLKEHIEDAQLMLAYASEQALQIDSAIIADIVSSRRSLQKNEFDKDKEIIFWNSFNALSKEIQPVCINSLKATRNYSGGPNKSKAAHTVFCYRISTLIVLIILICIQIYWGIGSFIITQIIEHSSFDQKIEKIQSFVEYQTEYLSKKGDNCSALGKFIDEYQDKEKDGKKHLEMYSELLKIWYSPFSNLVKIFVGRDKFFQDYQDEFETTGKKSHAAGGYIREKESAQLVLQPIQQYILPLLYGWIGALAYVLRSINRQIAEITYTDQSKEHYRLRVQLGTLSGLAIGWFLPVDLATSPSFSFGNLSPLALSFLAGYSVELLFSAMDKIVEAFSGK